MSNLDYKEGRGDYYRNEGIHEEKEAAIDRIEMFVQAGGPLRVALHAERKIVKLINVNEVKTEKKWLEREGADPRKVES